MFPSVAGTWTNSLGYQVSSHIFLLPSGTEKNQLELKVKGRKGTIKFLYPKKVFTTWNPFKGYNLPAHLQRYLQKVTKNEKRKSDVHEFTLDFDVQANPIHYEINYYKKRMDNRGRQHVLYVLEIDFESKERIEVPKEVQGGEFYGSDSDDETDSYVNPRDDKDDEDMNDGDGGDDEFHFPTRE